MNSVKITITRYESDFVKIDIQEVLSLSAVRGVTRLRLCESMGWSRGYFWGLCRKKHPEIHKNDAEKLENLLNAP